MTNSLVEDAVRDACPELARQRESEMRAQQYNAPESTEPAVTGMDDHTYDGL